MLFSSIAALLGSAGQASYAAANAGLDALAASLRRAGMPVASIQWGPWADAGMSAAQGSSAVARLRRLGFETLSAQRGLEALRWVMKGSGPGAVQTVGTLDWAVLLRGQTAPSSTLFEEMSEAVSGDGRVDQPGEARSALGIRADVLPAKTPGAGAQTELLAVVLKAASALTGAELAADEPVMAAGLDSLGALELRNALVAQLGLQLPATLAFDYPTPFAMADHIAALVQLNAGPADTETLPGMRALLRSSGGTEGQPFAASQTEVLASTHRLPRAVFCADDAAKDVVGRIPFEVCTTRTHATCILAVPSEFTKLLVRLGVSRWH